MVDIVRDSPFIIHRGIETIVREKHARIELPDHKDLAPAEATERPQLERLLALPNLDEFIAERLLPRLTDPRIVTPQRFRAVLEGMPDALRAAAERKPAAGRALGRAARLLVDGISTHQLLQMYRSALLQG